MNTRKFPNDARANTTRAWILYRLGRTSEANEAIQGVQRLARTQQMSYDSLFLFARLKVEQGDKDGAIQDLDRLLNAKTSSFVFRRQAEELLSQLKAE